MSVALKRTPNNGVENINSWRLYACVYAQLYTQLTRFHNPRAGRNMNIIRKAKNCSWPSVAVHLNTTGRPSSYIACRKREYIISTEKPCVYFKNASPWSVTIISQGCECTIRIVSTSVRQPNDRDRTIADGDLKLQYNLYSIICAHDIRYTILY